MTKMLKKRIVSSITALAMMLSIGTANAMDIGDFESADNKDDYVSIDCERVEELPDRGKIYVYNIDGVENSFPVPPKGFQLSAANIKEL